MAGMFSILPSVISPTASSHDDDSTIKGQAACSNFAVADVRPEIRERAQRTSVEQSEGTTWRSDFTTLTFLDKASLQPRNSGQPQTEESIERDRNFAERAAAIEKPKRARALTPPPPNPPSPNPRPRHGERSSKD